MAFPITQHEATAKQPGKVFKFEIASHLLPEHSNLTTVGQADGPCINSGTHAFALKAFKQRDQDNFKSENILKFMKNTIGKLSAEWIRKDDLELHHMAGTNLEKDNRGHSRSSPHSSSDQPIDKGRKRSTSWRENHGSEARRSPNGDGGDDHQDGRDDDKRIGAGTKRQKRQNQRMLACPYFKHDPVKYKNQRTCCGPGFAAMHRVK